MKKLATNQIVNPSFENATINLNYGRIGATVAAVPTKPSWAIGNKALRVTSDGTSNIPRIFNNVGTVACAPGQFIAGSALIEHYAVGGYIEIAYVTSGGSTLESTSTSTAITKGARVFVVADNPAPANTSSAVLRIIFGSSSGSNVPQGTYIDVDALNLYVGNTQDEVVTCLLNYPYFDGGYNPDATKYAVNWEGAENNSPSTLSKKGDEVPVTTITNKCPNPSAETSSVSPWVSTALKSFTTQPKDSQPWVVGSRYFRIVSNGANTQPRCYLPATPDYNAVTPGDWYFISLNAVIPVGYQARVNVLWFNSDKVQVSSGFGTLTTDPIVKNLIQIPSDIVYAQPVIILSKIGGGNVEEDTALLFDAVLICTGKTSNIGETVYFDGDSTSSNPKITYSWLGTPGASQSTMNIEGSSVPQDLSLTDTRMFFYKKEIAKTSPNILNNSVTDLYRVWLYLMLAPGAVLTELPFLPISTQDLERMIFTPGESGMTVNEAKHAFYGGSELEWLRSQQ